MRNALLALGALALVLLAALYRYAHETAPAASDPLSSVSRSSPAASPTAARDAAQLTARARLELQSDPAAALRAIAEADRASEPQAEQRRALEIVALVRLGRVGHARALAEAFYRAFPGSAQSARLERLTGAHPRPLGP